MLAATIRKLVKKILERAGYASLQLQAHLLTCWHNALNAHLVARLQLSIPQVLRDRELHTRIAWFRGCATILRELQ
jgi:hypothetical protein